MICSNRVSCTPRFLSRFKGHGRIPKRPRAGGYATAEWLQDNFERFVTSNWQRGANPEEDISEAFLKVGWLAGCVCVCRVCVVCVMCARARVCVHTRT